MKEENVLNVLMYLFKYHIHADSGYKDTNKQLIKKLERVGFERYTIRQAFAWLDQLGEQCFSDFKLDSANALRVYSEEEEELFDIDCRGFILLLEQHEILKPHTREMVINQSIALGGESIDIQIIKMVTLLVLFTQPNEKTALAYMEFLVLSDSLGVVH